ncbi:single-stranded DNA-binding protein [Virgibacillus sp. W0181]|uniref:single-stranded DNA-binding protein n=1 Tax=Virgibacillus sp. W0181 TaxID=3391581 RepID=UPI003F450578
MLNRVVIVGRLTKDPDLRYTPNGVAVANFTVAANRPFKNQQGENEADFINCVVWRRQAENLANYMSKGNLIGVDGRIQTRRFEGNDGKTVFVTEVVAEGIQFLEPKRSSQNQNRDQGGPGFQQQAQHQSQPRTNDADPFSNAGEPIDISDDDLPF